MSGGKGKKGAKMIAFRTHFTFRVDTWTPDGESIDLGERWPSRLVATAAQLRAAALVISGADPVFGSHATSFCRSACS
jgi:hypothetical protein